DRDSAHTSTETRRWCEEKGLTVLKGPPKSPDMSIMETWTKSLKGSFYCRRSASETAGLERIKVVFEKLDQDKINRSIDNYPNRLQKCIEFGGKMTKY